jgi:beta-lactamase superfamily II metal-dependent hydrolase
MEKKSALIILGTIFILNILAWLAVYDLSQSQFLEITFFDIGQGDSIFIESPQNHQILIDGGPTSIILEKLNTEMPFGDRTLDLVILTHPEHDHLAGLIEVLKNYQVENILWTGVLKETAEFQEWQRLIKEEGANIYIAQFGQKITWSRFHLDILYPWESFKGKDVRDVNNTSIVAKLVYGENSFLLTGDIAKSIERQLLGQAEQLDSDILKVAHHGSKTSSSQKFISAVSPEIAVIQCGKNNNYGHPHPETLEMLKKYDINILNTAEIGDIKIISNGKTYGVSSL